jgi:uncharacterized protein
MPSIVGRGWGFPIHLNNQGEIALAQDDTDIQQAIQLILGTALGERVMRPDFGCRIHELIFAPNDNVTAATAERYVKEALGRWEPRIRVTKIEAVASPDDSGTLMIRLDYVIKANHDARSLVFPFYLLPE